MRVKPMRSNPAYAADRGVTQGIPGRAALIRSATASWPMTTEADVQL